MQSGVFYWAFLIVVEYPKKDGEGSVKTNKQTKQIFLCLFYKPEKMPSFLAV